MTPESSYVAVLDIGSSRIIATLGCVENGQLHPIVSEKAVLKDEVRRGVIQKVGEVSRIVRELIDKIEQNPSCRCKINQITVGLNAYTLSSSQAISVLNFAEQTEIDESHLNQLCDDAIDAHCPEGKDMIDCFVQDYILDGSRLTQPKGDRCKRIEARYRMVTARPNIQANLEEMLHEARLDDTYIKLGLLASAEAVLSEDDKQRGAVVVDFGAQTTGICIIKEHIVRYLAVLPFGGENITRDLMSLDNLNRDECEKIKCQSGSAIHYSEHNQKDRSMGRSVQELSAKDKDISDIIVARQEEIVENIWAQIRYSSEAPQMLGAGIFMTGGASRMKDLDKLLEKKTQMKVHPCSLKEQLTGSFNISYAEPEYAQTYGLMRLAKPGGCVAVEEPDPQPATENASLFSDEEIPTVEAEKQPRTSAPKQKKQQKSGMKSSPWGGLFGGIKSAMSIEGDVEKPENLSEKSAEPYKKREGFNWLSDED